MFQCSVVLSGVIIMRKDITLLTDGNEKMQYTGKVNNCHMWTFSLPAQKTCPFKGECSRFCYASSGNYTCPEPVACYARNFEASKRADFVQVMTSQITHAINLDSKRGLPTGIRLHDTGDLYSLSYLLKWVKIAQNLPGVLIYGYTKSHPFFNDLSLPENLFFIPSEGGKRDDMIKHLPRARVVPIGYKCGLGEVPGDKDDLRNLSMVRDQRMVLCLEAHGAKRSSVK